MSDHLECPVIITRQWVEDACGKPATTMIRVDFEGKEYVEAACTYHAHRWGNAVPLTEDAAALIREAAES